MQATSFTSGWTKVQWFDKENNSVGNNTVYLEKDPKSETILDKLQISYNSVKALVDGVKYINGKSGSGWIELPKGSSQSASIGSTGTTYYLTFICD